MSDDGTVPTTLQPMTYRQAEERMQGKAREIRNAEKKCDEASEDAAAAEAVYRKALGEVVKGLRDKGTAVEAAQTQARSELFRLSRERDIAIGRVRLAYERLEDRRGERASLHKLVDWSAGIDVSKRRSAEHADAQVGT